MLEPTQEDTKVLPASEDSQIRALVQSGEPVAEGVIPHTAPQRVDRLALIGV